MIERILKIEDVQTDSVFLWGARQTGKSTLLVNLFPDATYIDLLRLDTFERLRRNPSLLREDLQSKQPGDIVIIDEVQKLPDLLNEVQWLIVRKDIHFILSGSSARKLKRYGTNLLGGRALRCRLLPLVSAEIPDFNLIKACNNGMLPRHYLTENATKRLQAYVGDYLQQEIMAEALSRNLSSFTRFLEVAALSDGEMVNYNNIASDCGVSAVTVKEYFSILEETLVGFMLPAYTKVRQRRVIKAPKFYYFDVGIVNYLTHRGNLLPGSADFGHAFEHFIVQELVAYVDYRQKHVVLSYWRTASGIEVDVVVSDEYSSDILFAIEIKSSEEIQNRHLKGLRSFRDEYPDTKLIVVGLDKISRATEDGISVLYATDFLKALWDGELF
ncbi:MAG: ATP-binding protein [Paludibacteraceae bacterium]|nr:ATP-binding protein [Paludibacteraceae bacterium]